MTNNTLYICGHDVILFCNSGGITIKNTQKKLFRKNIGIAFALFPVLGTMALLLAVIIMLVHTGLSEVTALSIVLLIVFIPCLVIIIKMFVWMQALLAGFCLTISQNQVTGHWGIIPIKVKLGNESRIDLSISHMRGTWGCRGKIIIGKNKFFSLSIFNPYAMFSHKKNAIDELIKISDFIKNSSCIPVAINIE